MEQDSCLGDLAEQLGITQSAVSRQLNLLKLNKLVRRRDGKMIFYTLVDEHVQIELRGYELTLRLDEAQKITVEKVHTKAEKNHATQRTMAVEHPGVGELGRANSYHVHNAANEISEGAKITFALVGNQNCGKTTLFNQLTGANGGSVRVNELEEILGIPVVPIPCFIGIIALVFVMTFSFIGAALSDLMGMGIDTVIALLDGMLAKAQVNPVVHSLVIAFVCLKVRDKKICEIGISWQL